MLSENVRVKQWISYVLGATKSQGDDGLNASAQLGLAQKRAGRTGTARSVFHLLPKGPQDGAHVGRLRKP